VHLAELRLLKVGDRPYVSGLYDHDKLLAHRNSAPNLGGPLRRDPVDWRKNVAVAQIQKRRVQLRFGGGRIGCARFVVGQSNGNLTGRILRVLLEFGLLLLQLRSPLIHHLQRGSGGCAACLDGSLLGAGVSKILVVIGQGDLMLVD